MSDDQPDVGFGSPNAWGYTLGTTSGQVLPSGVGQSRTGLIFHNPSATATIAVCPLTNSVTGEEQDAVINGAGSYTILPLAELRLVGLGYINCAWSAVADTPSSPITILEFFSS
jgi:hypothetical protein